MTIMCTFPYTQHALKILKRVLRCCAKYPSIVLSSQESNEDATNMCPIIIFVSKETYNIVHCMADVHINI